MPNFRQISVPDDKALCSSLDVAERFGKDHGDVLEKIGKILDASRDKAELNFRLSEYRDSTGRSLPCYELTRDGFSFLGQAVQAFERQIPTISA